MAQISEFSALRFTQSAGDIKDLTCPPYDIISDEQRKAYLTQNPNNIIRLELPREGSNPYEEAKKQLASWLSEKTLGKDSKEALYIYEEEFSVAEQTYKLRGFICHVHLEEFSKKVVLPHEETLSKAKQDRFDLMCATECNFSQVYSLYDDADQSVAALLDTLTSKEPNQMFKSEDGITHRLWIAEKSDTTEKICNLFADKQLFIADGHHRYETALRYYNYRKDNQMEIGDSDSMMMFLCDLQNTGLVVFPTHRVITNTSNFNSEDFLSFASEDFDIVQLPSFEDSKIELEAAYMCNEKAFGYYDGNSTYLLTLKDTAVMEQAIPGASKALRELDVSVLHKLLLEKYFGITKEVMAAGGRLTYTRSDEEAKELTDKDADCCFILNPTRVSEIRDVALAGEKMPQKSTYFYPKLITGMVMNKLI